MASLKLFVVCLAFFLRGSYASQQFRGGFITYRVDTQSQFFYDLTVLYTSAWEGTPNDCSGTTSGAVTLNDGNLKSNPNNLVACGTAGSSGIRVGSGSWSVTQNIKSTTPRSIRYQFSSGWRNFACCSSATNQIVLDTSTSPVAFNQIPNEPPIPTNFQVITIQQGNSGAFPITVTDREGDRIACRLAATAAEGGSIFASSQATAGGSNGCTIIIDATAKPPGQYPAAFVIEDFASGSDVALHTIPYQIVYVVTGEIVVTTPSSTGFPATVTCSPDLIEVSIPQSSFSGALPSADRVTFIDQNCRATLIDGKYELSTTLTTCGTSFIGETEDHLVYENSVTARRISNGLITRQFQITLKVTCRYTRKQTSENDKSFIPKGTITGQQENFGQFVLDLRAFDSTFTTPITTFPMDVDLGSRQYCQIDVQSSNPDVVVIVERIFASNSASRAGLPHYDLINNRCPSDNTVQFNNNGAIKDQFRFSFDAFAFTLDVTQQIYIHCDTFLCHSTSSDPRCLQTCTGDQGLNVNNVRRVGGIGRRSLDEQMEKGVVAIDEPSKIYFLVVGPYERYSTNDKAVSVQDKGKSFWDEEHFIILACTMILVFIIIVAFFVFKLRLAKQKLEISRDQGFSKAMA